MPYIGNSPKNNVRDRFYYTATSGQTTFSGSDLSGRTLSYQDGRYVDVYLNGVILQDTTDYTATTKTSVTLVSGATTGDLVEIIAYGIFSVSDTVSAKDGGTFSGNVNVNGDLTVDTSVLKVDASGNKVGIGTASPDTIADIAGSGVPLEIDSTNSNTYKVQFKNNGTVTSYLGTTSNAFYFGNSSAAQLARLDSDGLKFGTDSAAANAIDDYEEGSIAASDLTDQSGAGLSLTFNAGNYVKVGTLVHFELDFSFPTTSNTSTAQVGALPFTFQSNFGSGTIGYHTRGADTYVYSIGATKNLRFPSNGGSNLTNANMSGVRIIMAITYRST